MKVVITGGLGYIGSRLAAKLSSEGHEVLALDHPSSVSPTTSPRFEIVRCDITDPASLKKVTAKGFDAILHLAAQSSGPRSFQIPDVDIKINILGTLNTIQWGLENQIKRMIFASSFVVYGDGAVEKLKEDMSCQPKSVYAVSKLAAERLLSVYAEPKGMEWNVLRMFNVYGEGQDLSRTDQGMAAIFTNYVKNGDHVPVQGRLDRFRDLIYIDDVIQGWELCLKNGKPNTVYNLGSGAKTKISTLIDTIISAYGKTGKVKVEQTGSTQGDILGCYADLTQTTKDLGYVSKVDLQTGIQKLVDWAKTV